MMTIGEEKYIARAVSALVSIAKSLNVIANAIEHEPDKDDNVVHADESASEVVKLTYSYTDDWSRPTYVSADGMVFKDVNCGRGKPHLFSVTSAGEPDCPVHFDYVFVTKN